VQAAEVEVVVALGDSANLLHPNRQEDLARHRRSCNSSHRNNHPLDLANNHQCSRNNNNNHRSSSLDSANSNSRSPPPSHPLDLVVVLEALLLPPTIPCRHHLLPQPRR